MSSPSVLHVDLDAFYVAMELLRRPELAGTPVVVGFDGPRGVVSTASYEARAFGVHSALPMAQAKRRCPQATYLPVDFSYYVPASERFHAILRGFTPVCEAAGTDEAYLDVAGSARLFGDGEAIAGAIRERVRSEIGITASVGVATNKLIAKVASDAAKPDGVCVVAAGEEAAFLAPRPVRHLPMVGAKLEERLAQLGLRTIGEVAAFPEEALRERFGRMGEELHARSQGRFDAPVLEQRGTAKSVSRETTFGTDVGDRARLRAILRTQSERVARDLARSGLAARTVVLKLRFPPFETLTRSWTGVGQVALADEIFEAGAELFERAWREEGARPVRLIGVGVMNIRQPARQLKLGETFEADRLADTVNSLRDRFGEDSVRRATEIAAERGESGE